MIRVMCTPLIFCSQEFSNTISVLCILSLVPKTKQQYHWGRVHFPSLQIGNRTAIIIGSCASFFPVIKLNSSTLRLMCILFFSSQEMRQQYHMDPVHLLPRQKIKQQHHLGYMHLLPRQKIKQQHHLGHMHLLPRQKIKLQHHFGYVHHLSQSEFKQQCHFGDVHLLPQLEN